MARPTKKGQAEQKSSPAAKFFGDYAMKQKKRLDEKGTLDLGIAPKFGPVFPKGGGSTARASNPRTGAKGAAKASTQAARPLPGKVTQANRPIPKAKATKSFTAASKPAKKPYVAKGPAPRNRDVGDFYLNATSGMFSKDAGGKKKKR
jgi:hypothetical protein